MQSLGERMTLALSAPLIGAGLFVSSIGLTWADRTYGGVLVICASIALATPSRQARGLAFGAAVFGPPILSAFVASF